jgi:hypothetical protein
MFKLENGNVVKIVATEQEKNKLISKGFIEVPPDDETGGGRSGKVRKAKADTGDRGH